MSAERISERAGLISARSNQMMGTPPDGFSSGGAIHVPNKLVNLIVKPKK